MAGSAAHVGARMQRIERVHVLGPARVATQAAGVDFFRGMLLEDKNLGLVSAARDVRCARSVATLASLTRWPSFSVERGLPMSGLLPAIKDVRMTRLASF